MRILSLILASAVLLFVGAAASQQEQPAPKKIKGDHSHLAIHGDTVTVVKSLPFKITCDDGAKLWFWEYPESWQAEGNYTSALNVASAKEGSYTVSVVSVSQDWSRQTHTIAVHVGKVPQPEPDEPDDPEPDDPLYQSLKAAAAKDKDQDKVGILAELYLIGSEKTAFEPSLKTNTDLLLKMRAARELAIGDSLPITRRAIADYLNGVLPRAIDTPLDDMYRKAASVAFGKIGTYLKRIK